VSSETEPTLESEVDGSATENLAFVGGPLCGELGRIATHLDFVRFTPSKRLDRTHIYRRRVRGVGMSDVLEHAGIVDGDE
jgi:hypothetical protein